MPIFTPPSRLQVPTHTSHTTPYTLTTRSCQHGWPRKVHRGLLLLLKARCLHRACRKNQTVIFVLPRCVLSLIRGNVRERSSAMTKSREAAAEESPPRQRRENSAKKPGTRTLLAPQVWCLTNIVRSTRPIIPDANVPTLTAKPVMPPPG